MISTVRCSKFIRLLQTAFGFNAEHIHTDGTQYEYVWALAFYEKRHEVIFIQLSLWNNISLLKKACMKPKSSYHCM